MPKSITRYRVFIASPQGLDEERKCFNDRLTWFSRVHGPDGDVEFQPVGWEVTIGGYGRPQSHINETLLHATMRYLFYTNVGAPRLGEVTLRGPQRSLRLPRDFIDKVE
jgi:hypothetical protein